MLLMRGGPNPIFFIMGTKITSGAPGGSPSLIIIKEKKKEKKNSKDLQQTGCLALCLQPPPAAGFYSSFLIPEISAPISAALSPLLRDGTAYLSHVS